MIVKQHHVDLVGYNDVILISDIELLSNDFDQIGAPVLSLNTANVRLVSVSDYQVPIRLKKTCRNPKYVQTNRIHV